jgi:hypothetical protein
MAKPSTSQLTLDEAYQATFLWFDHKGEPPIEITEPAHGSVQLETESTLARVRWADSEADHASVLGMLRIAKDGKRLAIFSASGFTTGAISVAETQGVALFAFDVLGVAHPLTTHARSLAPDPPPNPPFAPPVVEEEEEDFWARPSNPPVTEEDEEQGEELESTVVDPDDWVDCPTCGTTHFKSAQFCRECGTHLASGLRHLHGSTPAEVGLVCRTCGGTDIGVETPTD